MTTHADGQKHKSAFQARKTSTTLSNFFTKKDSKLEDRVAAVEVSKTFHSIKHRYSYLSSDCGNKLDSEIYADSDIAQKLQLGRTKMEAIVKNVLCPFAIETVLDKLKTPTLTPFSISTEASNKGNRKFI